MSFLLAGGRYVQIEIITVILSLYLLCIFQLAFVAVPSKGPDNVLFSNVTHESAVVSWLSIPVEDQRGFLQQYLIWISGQENTSTVNV